MRRALCESMNDAFDDMVLDLDEPVEEVEVEKEEKCDHCYDRFALEDTLYKALEEVHNLANKAGRSVKVDDITAALSDEMENFSNTYEDVSVWKVIDDEVGYMLVVGADDSEVVDAILKKVDKVFDESDLEETGEYSYEEK